MSRGTIVKYVNCNILHGTVVWYSYYSSTIQSVLSVTITVNIIIITEISRKFCEDVSDEDAMQSAVQPEPTVSGQPQLLQREIMLVALIVIVHLAWGSRQNSLRGLLLGEVWPRAS